MIQKLYKLKFLLLMGAFLSTVYVTNGQTKTLRIKFNPSENATLQSTRVSQSSDGIPRIGISSVDQLNERFDVSSMKRLFPPAGKFEKKHEKYGLHLWYEITVDQRADLTALTKEYQSLREISIAETIKPKTIGLDKVNQTGEFIKNSLPNGTNDPRFNEQWHYNNTGQTGGTVDADIDLPEAWMIETGSSEVIVSVHDGGIDFDHVDISGNMWINSNEIAGNGIDDDGNGYVDDIYGYNFADGTGTIDAGDHGTHTSGTIAAETNNGTGMSGIAGGSGSNDGIRLMSCETFGASTSGGFAESYIYAADNGAIISQNSWGYTSAGAYDQAILDAIDYFIAEAGKDEDGNQTGPMAGGVVVFAAGNDGSDGEWYPGYYEPVIAVAATDLNDNGASYSNRGSWVDLAAPGSNVLSTYPNDSYGAMTGTSMACPHVSGVAALIVSKFKDDGITPEGVRNRLVSTTDPLTFDGAEKWGSGRLNAFSALIEDDGEAPTAVTDLSAFATGTISAILTLTAPSDLPDGYSVGKYILMGSKSPITSDNFSDATPYKVKTPGLPGMSDTIIISGLSPGTTYYFALKSSDFFGNTSEISNVVSTTTEVAPEIVISGNPDVEIDVSIDSVASGTFNIGNHGQTDLNFNISSAYLGRTSPSATLVYPGNIASIVPKSSSRGNLTIKTQSNAKSSGNNVGQNFHNEFTNTIIYDDGDEEADGSVAVTSNGTPVTWAATSLLEVPNSLTDGFTLTHVSSYIKASSSSSATTLISIIKGGNTPSNGELLLSQEVQNEDGDGYVSVPLEMPLKFQAGDKFWIVYSYAAVSIRLGYDEISGGSRPGAYLAYFNDEWIDLQSQSGWDEYVWDIRAIESTVEGLSISLKNGTVTSGNSQDITLTYNAATTTRNGDYHFNVFVSSNDPLTPTKKIECTAKVTGLPTPSISVNPDTVNSKIDVAQNPVKVETLTIYNTGLGEMMFDLTKPVVETGYSIPAVSTDFPKGSAAPSLERAPEVKFSGSTLPVIQLDGTVAYGHDMYPGSDLISLNTESPGSYLTSTSVSYTAYAGDFAANDDKTMYIIDNDNVKLVKLNIETGETETIGASLLFTDLACDKSSGIMYAAYYNSTSSSSELYTVDLNTGTPTLIGESASGVMISIACDGNGKLWGLNLDDNLYAINTETGAATSVGSVGFDANYAQSMAWDPESDIIYMSAYNNSSSQGELRIVDTETGATALVGAFPSGAEVCAFGFPGGSSTDLLTASPLSGTVPAGSSVDISLTIDATNLANGDYRSSVKVFSNDFDNPTLTVPVNLSVSGQVGDIEISSEFLEFGAVFTNSPKELPLIIKNNGIGDLTISDITSELSLFYTDFEEPVVLGMGDSTVVNVIFSSSFLGQFNTVLTIASDDPKNSTTKVTVVGTAITPPVIAVTPTEMEVTLDAGETTSKTVVISNTGLYPLQYSLPGVAVTSILADTSIEKNNTAFIPNLTIQSSKEELDTRVGHPVVLGAGGPDEFGYQWIDSKEEGGPIYSWVDISETGAEILEGSNDGSTKLELPFPFTFYGETKSEITVGSNGYLTFGTDGTDYTNDQIPSSTDPNDFIAPYWDDLRPASYTGHVYYQASADKFVIQYQEVGSYPTTATGTMTFQAILYPNGNIEFVYKDYSLENKTGATIGIENADADAGLQVAFNTEYIESEMSILILPGKTPFDLTASKVSGIIQPHGQQEIELFIDATDLVEGSYINELTISSNDPLHAEKTVTTTLDVIGHPAISIAPDSLEFEPIFKGLSSTKAITIENTGSKNLSIESIVSSSSAFTVDSTAPFLIAPKAKKTVPVTFTALEIGNTVGEVLIKSNDEFGYENMSVYLSGTGLVPPEMVTTVTPNPANFVLDHGDVDTLTISVANNGGSTLEYVVAKPHYSKLSDVSVSSEKPELISKEEADTRVGKPVLLGSGGPDAFGYSWVDSDESEEVTYDWIEISSIGTKIDLPGDGNVDVSLPFSFPFYHEVFNSVKVASNGFLTFGDELGSLGGYSNQDIPSTVAPNYLIAPLWDDIEPQNGDGVYMYATPNYVVFQYNEVPKFYSTTTTTFEAILYPSGAIKFQYKDVENYSGISSCTVGIESEDGEDALPVVFNSKYLKDELAVMINSPFITGSVPVGMTANIDLLIETENLMGGVYSSDATIISNDPANSSIAIPTSLTVIGKPIISINPDSLLFDRLYYIDGETSTASGKITIANVGSDTLTIDSMFIDVDAMDTIITGDFSYPVKLAPGDSINELVYFTPTSVGTYAAYFKVLSDDPSITGYSELIMVGSAVAPPMISVKPMDTLKLNLLSKEVSSTVSTVTNLGGSLLEYTAKIVSTTESSKELSEVKPIYTPLTTAINASRSVANTTALNVVETSFNVEFSDSMIYDPEAAPKDYYGYNSAAAYSSANKFVVTASSFSLTHVANYYQNQGDSTPVVMEVWLGGNLPAAGTLVATQSFYHSEAHSGANCLIKLDTALTFKEGDVFFVVMHYPQSIGYPAAFNSGVSEVEGVSYWYDANASAWAAETDSTVYKIRAYQATTDSTAPSTWLSISPEVASIDSGISQKHDLLVNASMTTPGVHKAKVVYTSNDPATPVVEWPIEITINAVPEIVSTPPDTLYMSEGETLDVTIKAHDSDGDSLTFALTDEYSFVSIETMPDSAIVTLEPTYEDAGEYGFGLFVTDEKGESVYTSWIVVVHGTNRSPVVVNDIDSKLYFETDDIDAMDLTAYFSDPDGDELSFSVISSNTSALDVDVEDNMLYVAPLEIGTGVISVIASDLEGLDATISFNARVRHSENHAPELTNALNNMVLMPDADATTLDLNDYFTDIDWDEIEYSFMLAGTASVNVSLSGSQLTLSPWQSGMAVITIYADDNRGGVTATTMGVLVSGFENKLPFLFALLSNRSYTSLNSVEYINLNNFFDDPDGDNLTYIAKVESGKAVSVDVENNVLAITPVSEGEATIAVYASDDNSGIASTRFKATVANPTGIESHEISKNSLMNYPNPARDITTFVYELAGQGHVKLELYTATGSYVDLIVDETQSTGKYSTEYSVDDLPSGVYFYRLMVDGKQIKQHPLTIK